MSRKIVFMGDVHLGYMQYGLRVRRDDFLAAFERALLAAAQLEPDLVIQVGDLFHDVRPSNELLVRTADLIDRRLPEKTRMIAIHGNHDYTRIDVTPLQVLQRMTNRLTVLTAADRAVESFCHENVNIVAVRYLYRTELSEWGQLRIEAEKRVKRDAINVFVCHLPINLPRDFGNVYWGPGALTIHDLPRGFSLYITGHHHDYHKVSLPPDGSGKKRLFIYTGALERTSHAESEHKRLTVLEMSENKNRIRNIRLAVRPFILVSSEEDVSSLTERLEECRQRPVIIIPASLRERLESIVEDVESKAYVVTTDVAVRESVSIEASDVSLKTIDRDELLRKTLEERGLAECHPVVSRILREAELIDDARERKKLMEASLNELVDTAAKCVLNLSADSITEDGEVWRADKGSSP